MFDAEAYMQREGPIRGHVRADLEALEGSYGAENSGAYSH